MSIDKVLISQDEAAVNLPAPLTALQARRPATAKPGKGSKPGRARKEAVS